MQEHSPAAGQRARRLRSDQASSIVTSILPRVAFEYGQVRLDTWVLFCRAVLGLDAAAAVKLAGPFGLIRSSGMADTTRHLRLVLNTSMSERTRIAQAAQASGGVGVHHIAFASDNLFASVERLKVEGVRFVPISDNYYDDLPTRFDLDLAFVEKLRAASVLLDRAG